MLGKPRAAKYSMLVFCNSKEVGGTGTREIRGDGQLALGA